MIAKSTSILLLLILLLSGCARSGDSSIAPLSNERATAQRAAIQATRNYAFVNGLWFDGERFETHPFYSVEGYLTRQRPARVDTIIDLQNGYVVPPFGEAHNHNVEGATVLGLQTVIDTYLKQGVFYVKNPNILPRARRALEGQINTPMSLDVTFANGGLTATGGHPYAMAQRNIRLNPNWHEDDGEGGFYHTIDNLDDLQEKWPRIVAGRPDFIKTYLLYSEEYEQRRDNATYDGWKGLNPEILPEIVRRAQSAHLRVSTHIETAADFHHAVRASVDEINHMPGFRPQEGIDYARYRIAPEDAEMAAEKGIVVVTTLARGLPTPGDLNAPTNRAYNALHQHNLSLLKEHGVTLVIGRDAYRDFTWPEVQYLRHLDVFSSLELLKMWSEKTPRTIFPSRKLGVLLEGYEASFLVLENNPLDDIAHTQQIKWRFKQGAVIPL